MSKGVFTDFMKFLIGHFPIGGVFNPGDGLAFDDVLSYLAQENAVGTDFRFRAVRCDGASYEVRRDGAIEEDGFGFLFRHRR